MKKFFILLSCLALGVFSLASAQNNDSLSSLISSHHKHGAALWAMLAENYRRFDSIGCEWSDWTSNGFTFTWLDRQNCQVVRRQDHLRLTFYNYHLAGDRPIRIVLINEKGYYVFTASNKNSGLYYQADSHGKEILSAGTPPSHRFVRLGISDCHKFNRTIKEVMRTIGRHTERLRD